MNRIYDGAGRIDGGSMQNPWASTRSGALNLLRKFSMAIPAVSSTSWASLNAARKASNKASSTVSPVVVMRSA